MRQLLEKLFPVLSTKDSCVEKSWNLYDIMNLLEAWTFLLIKTALSTFLSLILEILKFILILLLTYAFALLVFYMMESIFSESNGYKSSDKKNKIQTDSGRVLKQQNSQQPYPYTINYNSEEENGKTRTEPNRSHGLDSDGSDDAIVRMGSFRRPSPSAEGENSIIGRAIEDLKNASTSVNENQLRGIESNLSEEANSSNVNGEIKSRNKF